MKFLSLFSTKRTREAKQEQDRQQDRANNETNVRIKEVERMTDELERRLEALQEEARFDAYRLWLKRNRP